MNNKYDAIVVGAGIGGLICGCYLAKNGLKTLIAEQHFQPGGCCTSFKRNGFIFDAGGHYFGGLRPGGSMRSILDYLELPVEEMFICADPIDKLVFPDFTIDICQDKHAFAAQLRKFFPEESTGIDGFFEEIQGFNYTKSFQYRGKSFQTILDQYFRQQEIKAVFDILILYIGLTSATVSAISAILLFKEFILDGGYYPRGGMQAFPDHLVKTFLSYGGTMALSQRVEKIKITDGRCKGVVLSGGRELECRYVVSNGDAFQTYHQLIGTENVSKDTLESLSDMELAVSHFVTYIGLESKLSLQGEDRCNTWYVPGYDVGRIYDGMLKNPVKNDGFIHIAFPSFHDSSLAPKQCDTAFLTVLAPFRDKDFWDSSRERLSDILIRRIDEKIPGFAAAVKYKGNFTPHTIERYTLNRQGANYGWAMSPQQSGLYRLAPRTGIKGIYMAGHWTRPGCGLSTVAQSGAAAARMIVKQAKSIKI